MSADSPERDEPAETADEPEMPGGRRDEPGSLRELWRIALPLVLSAGSLSVMNFCDRLFLTGYSEDALAASLPAHLLHWILLALPLGTAFYANTFVAQYDGAGRIDRVGKALWQAIYLATAAGVLFTMLVPFSPWIFEKIDHPPGVQEQEVAYFGALCAGSVPILLAPVFACFYIGRGKSNVVLFANLASVALNLVLDPLLIYGFLGFPEWGAFGAAVGTVCGRTLACVVYVWLLTTSDDAKPYAIWSHQGFDAPLFRRMVWYGLPNGFFWFVDVTAFSVMILLVGQLGNTELAATTLAFNLNALAFIPMIGIGHSVSTLVGRRIGEGKPELAVRTTWSGVKLAGGYMAAWAVLYLLAPYAVVAPYAWINNIEDFDEIQNLVVVLLRFVAVYSLFDAMAVVFSNAVRGAGDTRFSMIFTFLTSWLVLAVPVIVLRTVFDAGLLAMWTACTLYVVIVGTGFLIRFEQGHWKSMKVIEDELPDDLAEETPADEETEPVERPAAVAAEPVPMAEER